MLWDVNLWMLLRFISCHSSNIDVPCMEMLIFCCTNLWICRQRRWSLYWKPLMSVLSRFGQVSSLEMLIIIIFFIIVADMHVQYLLTFIWTVIKLYLESMLNVLSAINCVCIIFPLLSKTGWILCTALSSDKWGRWHSVLRLVTFTHTPAPFTHTQAPFTHTPAHCC